MACVDGSQSIRLGSNSAQIPGLLSQTKPLGQPEPQKQIGQLCSIGSGGTTLLSGGSRRVPTWPQSGLCGTHTQLPCLLCDHH